MITALKKLKKILHLLRIPSTDESSCMSPLLEPVARTGGGGILKINEADMRFYTSP